MLQHLLDRVVATSLQWYDVGQNNLEAKIEAALLGFTTTLFIKVYQRR